MDDQFLNQLTRSLIRHQSFIKKAKYNQTLHYAVIRMIRLIRENQILEGIVEELEGNVENLEAVKSSASIIVAGNGAPDFNEEMSFVLCSFYVLELCSGADIGAEIQAGKTRCLNPSLYSECLESFFSEYVEPLVTYLIDKLNDSQYILSNIVRFKQQVEWFERDEIRTQINQARSQNGIGNSLIEKALNNRLYKYLHNKGVEFYIEPSTAQSRGRVDLIGAQGSSPQLLLDGKYLGDANALKGYVISAFSQVYNYTQQYNRPAGYIVLFKDVEQQIKFNFSNFGQDANYVILNNKKIYFVLIDITNYSSTPSQRGRPQVIEIAESDLTSSVEI